MPHWYYNADRCPLLAGAGLKAATRHRVLIADETGFLPSARRTRPDRSATLLKDAQRQRRANRRRQTAAADRAVVAGAATGAVDRAEGVPVSTSSDVSIDVDGVGRTRRERRCYACRDRFRTVDVLYHALCLTCAALHRQHRDSGPI